MTPRRVSKASPPHRHADLPGNVLENGPFRISCHPTSVRTSEPTRPGRPHPRSPSTECPATIRVGPSNRCAVDISERGSITLYQQYQQFFIQCWHPPKLFWRGFCLGFRPAGGLPAGSRRPPALGLEIVLCPAQPPPTGPTSRPSSGAACRDGLSAAGSPQRPVDLRRSAPVPHPRLERRGERPHAEPRPPRRRGRSLQRSVQPVPGLHPVSCWAHDPVGTPATAGLPCTATSSRRKTIRSPTPSGGPATAPPTSGSGTWRPSEARTWSPTQARPARTSGFIPGFAAASRTGSASTSPTTTTGPSTATESGSNRTAWRGTRPTPLPTSASTTSRAGAKGNPGFTCSATRHPTRPLAGTPASPATPYRRGSNSCSTRTTSPCVGTSPRPGKTPRESSFAGTTRSSRTSTRTSEDSSTGSTRPASPSRPWSSSSQTTARWVAATDCATNRCPTRSRFASRSCSACRAGCPPAGSIVS